MCFGSYLKEKKLGPIPNFFTGISERKRYGVLKRGETYRVPEIVNLDHPPSKLVNVVG